MAAELTVLSFLCAIFLVVFLPIKRVYSDAPKLAIILWLLAYNLIHAINSVIWVGNDDIRAVGWCDVATKIMMGANMALPGAFLCLSRRLELVSSSRPISTHKTVERNRTILEIVLCCILPILYMSLHFVAQDYRFDLVKKFGCSPSVHQSTLGFILIWGPPLILSVISLVLSAFALHHARSHHARSLTSYRFMEHLQPRSTVITTSIFYRQLSITMIISSLLVFFNIFVFFSVSHYVPWVSWASVHATVSDVDVVQSGSILRTIQVRWWSVFIVSLIYILLCFAFGEETRDAYQYMKRLSARFGMASTSRPAVEGPSSSAPKAKGAKMRPLTLELKSGWDDMLHERSPRLKSIRSKSPMLSSPSACSSPTPSSKSRAEDDEAFMTSTLSYLGSPAAKSLGITSPVTPTTPSPRAAFELLSNPIPSPPPPMPSTQSAPSTPSTPPKPAPAKLPSHITVVLAQEWPVPPASPSPSRSVSRHGSPSPTGSISRAHSRINSQPDSCSQSPTASVLDEGIDLSEITFGIPLYSPSTPPHLRARPFENSSISSMNELGVHTPTSPNAPMPPKRGILKRPSMRSLNRKFSRERLSSGSSTAPGDVIRMSIVHETV